MKNLTFIFLFVSTIAFPQAWDWALKASTTTSTESVRKLKADAAGNIYLLGDSHGSQYGSTAISGPLVIAKFNTQGTVLWAKDLNNLQAINFSIDATGNVYIFGHFTGTANVLSYTFVSQGQEDIYIVKLDPSGTALWGKRFGGTDRDLIGDLVLDQQQNIYLTGWFINNFSFDSYSFVDSTGHLFLAKLDPSGSAQWVTKGDSSLSSGNIVRLDSHNNIYTAGGSSAYYGASHIARFDNNGTELAHFSLLGLYDNVYDLAISDADNIYYIRNGVGHYGFDPIIIKNDLQMNQIWSVNSGTYYGCYEMGEEILLDHAENCYICGIIGTEFCGNDSIYFMNQLAYVGTNGVPAFAKLNASGNLDWVKTGNSTDYDGFRKYAMDASGNMYGAGSFNYPTKNGYGDTLSFDNTMLFPDGNWQQIFLAKLNPTGAVKIKEFKEENMAVFPNPSTGVFYVRTRNSSNPAKLIVHDILGNCVYTGDCNAVGEKRIDLSAQAAGIYFVELHSGDKKTIRKIVIE
ncbi:MAG: T9SS type A sorting domain-containing protein [Bacteroidia bacterium]